MAEYNKSVNYIKSKFRARRLRLRTSHLVYDRSGNAGRITLRGSRVRDTDEVFVLFRLRMPPGHFGLSRCWHSQKSKILEQKGGVASGPGWPLSFIFWIFHSTTFLSASHSTLGRMISSKNDCFGILS